MTYRWYRPTMKFRVVFHPRPATCRRWLSCQFGGLNGKFSRASVGFSRDFNQRHKVWSQVVNIIGDKRHVFFQFDHTLHPVASLLFNKACYFCISACSKTKWAAPSKKQIDNSLFNTVHLFCVNGYVEFLFWIDFLLLCPDYAKSKYYLWFVFICNTYLPCLGCIISKTLDVLTC